MFCVNNYFLFKYLILLFLPLFVKWEKERVGIRKGPLGLPDTQLHHVSETQGYQLLRISHTVDLCISPFVNDKNIIILNLKFIIQIKLLFLFI